MAENIDAESGEAGLKEELDQAVGVDSEGDAVEVSETETLSNELEATKDKYVRLLAEFDNYKKRTLKEQSELMKYQGERLVVELLEVLDNLELALSHSTADHAKLKEGLAMVHKMFVDRLARWEIRGESGMGAQFDPHKHAAISQVPGSDAEPGTIVGELKKPYFYKDKLIRVGEVVVATEGEVSN